MISVDISEHIVLSDLEDNAVQQQSCVCVDSFTCWLYAIPIVDSTRS